METKIKYLIDTNIWLERLLDQDKSDIVFSFFEFVPIDQIFISDFSFHSIGVILSKFKRLDTFDKFVRDIFFNGQIEQVSLHPTDFLDLSKNIMKFNLDFDDAYQLTVSRKYNMVIITFDKDFNINGINKSSPEEIIESYRK